MGEKFFFYFVVYIFMMYDTLWIRHQQIYIGENLRKNFRYAKIAKNFANLFEIFRKNFFFEIIRKIFRNIAKIFSKIFGKIFSKCFAKFFEILRKYFRIISKQKICKKNRIMISK